MKDETNQGVGKSYTYMASSVSPSTAYSFFSFSDIAPIDDGWILPKECK